MKKKNVSELCTTIELFIRRKSEKNNTFVYVFFISFLHSLKSIENVIKLNVFFIDENPIVKSNEEINFVIFIQFFFFFLYGKHTHAL